MTTEKPLPPIPPSTELDPHMLTPGITGADLSLPIFDGRSDNPADHLIDLETDSMEKYLDVRLYFWLVGVADEECNQARPWSTGGMIMSHEELLERDERLVKAGREILKTSKARGEGYYVSPRRDILANNHIGNICYRLPAIGIAHALRSRELEAFEDEGVYYCDPYEVGTDWQIGSIIKTNIRIPILWTECLMEGVVPGTLGWEEAVTTHYQTGNHPACMVEDRTMSYIIRGIFGNNISDPSIPCEYRLMPHILETNWPNIEEIKEEEEEAVPEADPEVKAKLAKHMRNMDDFFFGKKKYRTK